MSDMPREQMEAFKQRMGWTMPTYSSRGTSFSADCGAGGGFGISVFLREGDEMYRTYFTRARGEAWEDSPEGFPQTPPYEWWQHHDEYDT